MPKMVDAETIGKIIRMKDEDRLSFKEIGEKLELNSDTVGKHYHENKESQNEDEETEDSTEPESSSEPETAVDPETLFDDTQASIDEAKENFQICVKTLEQGLKDSLIREWLQNEIWNSSIVTEILGINRKEILQSLELRKEAIRRGWTVTEFASHVTAHNNSLGMLKELSRGIDELKEIKYCFREESKRLLVQIKAFEKWKNLGEVEFFRWVMKNPKIIDGLIDRLMQIKIQNIFLER